jgi:hypothetical protein
MARLSLLSLPVDVRLRICKRLQERDEFLVLRAVCHELCVDISSDAFFASLGTRPRFAIGPWCKGCQWQRAHAPDKLLNGAWHLRGMRTYLEQPQLLDLSKGREQFPLTVCIRLRFAGKDFYAKPLSICTDPTRQGSPQPFVYDAGPRPAAFACQVFRSGEYGSLGFGLRVLEAVPADTFVLTYHGAFAFKDWNFSSRAQKYELLHAATPPHLQQGFGIDATARGNMARWINHSPDPNLETRLMPSLGEPMLGFFSTRHIEAGEELFWNYHATSKTRIGNKAWKWLPQGGVMACDEAVAHVSADGKVSFHRAVWKTVNGTSEWGESCFLACDRVAVMGHPPTAGEELATYQHVNEDFEDQELSSEDEEQLSEEWEKRDSWEMPDATEACAPAPHRGLSHYICLSDALP